MYKNRIPFYINLYRLRRRNLFTSGLFIFGGTVLVAISLQLFLVKNNIIDGGIVGIAIILTKFFHVNIGILLFILNTPFLFIGFYFLGIRFLVLSLYASVSLSIGTFILEPQPAITDDPVIIVVIGGFLLGLGVGTIIRFGGSLDGTEIMAILMSKRTPFSIGQSVMIFNFFIFGCSIFVFGLKEAIFSLATFFIAYRTIDFSIKH